jgi:hypothetical protein
MAKRRSIKVTSGVFHQFTPVLQGIFLILGDFESILVELAPLTFQVELWPQRTTTWFEELTSTGCISILQLEKNFQQLDTSIF